MAEKQQDWRLYGYRMAKKLILPIGIILCAVASSPFAADPSLVIRHIIWCVVTLVLCVGLLLSRRKNLGVLQTPLFTVFVLYCLATTFSITQAVNSSEALYFILLAWISLIFFACAAVTVDKKVVINSMVYLGLVLSIFGLYDIIRAENIVTELGLGFANCRNLWSSTLLLLMPFLLYSFFKNRSRLAAIATVLLLVNIIFLQTRSVYLALFAATLVTLVIYNKKAAVLLVAVVIVCCLMFPRLRNIDSLSYRFQCWSRTAKMFRDDPIFGVGAGNWKIATPKYGNNTRKHGEDSTREQHFQRAHNDFFEVFTETGILGGLSYISIFVLAIYYTWRMRDKVLAWAMRFGVVSYVVFASFSFPKERAIHSMLVFVMIALIAKDYPIRKQWSAKRNVKTFAVCASILLFALFVNYHRHQTEAYCVRAMNAKARRDWKEVINIIDRNYTPFSTMLSYAVTPIYYYRGEANFYLGNNEAALANYLKAHKLHPNHAAVLANIGYYRFRERNYSEAEYFYSRANDVFPNQEVITRPLKMLRKRYLLNYLR